MSEPSLSDRPASDAPPAGKPKSGAKQAVKAVLRWTHRSLNAVRLVPHLIIWRLSPERGTIELDMQRWVELPQIRAYVFHRPVGVLTFIDLMGRTGACLPFRSLFYHRTRRLGRLFSFLCPPDPSLHIDPYSEIGPGLFIQHGWDAVIGPRKLGRNCWINQQVTIAFANETDAPIIGDNVTINAGARLIGGVRIGNNVTIGAGTVIVKDVPDNCVVVGGPSYIVRRNGVRTREQL